jgi:hypothetical protein
MQDAKAVRAELVRRLNEFVIELGRDMPDLEAGDVIRLAIGYFAEVHAQHFGHAATVDMVAEIAGRGVQPAAEELTAPRN